MAAIWLNRVLSDEERRKRLYSGEIFVYDRLQSVADFVTHTRAMVEAALAPHDPRQVHEFMSPADLAALLGRLKPAFTHDPETRRLVVRIFDELGTSTDDCHMDVPKLRTAFPPGHLTKGIAYALPAHRDVWYGAPQAQINWWLPIYPLSADNAMSFYPRYFSEPVANDSDKFNYYRLNVDRKDLTKFVDSDPRVRPAASALDEDEPTFLLLPDVGGMILFSAAHLHATATSPGCLSRYSVDFRTVSLADVELGRGAPNVDVHCTGTALRDFRRAKDGAPMLEMHVHKLDPVGPTAGQVAVFDPGAQTL